MLLNDLDENISYTYADYYKWDFDERVELIDGKIYRMSPAPNPVHQLICGDIHHILKGFLEDKSCLAFMAPFDVRLPCNIKDDKSVFTVLQPDVCVICDRQKIDKKGCIGAPDIVVEVLSSGNNRKEIKNKYDVYESSGVKEYWVVSPQNQTVVVYTLIAGKFQPSRILTSGDLLQSSVLPGFSLDLARLFKIADTFSED